MQNRASREDWWDVPADDVQNHDEIVIFEVGHVRSQDVRLHFQLDVLWREIRTVWFVQEDFVELESEGKKELGGDRKNKNKNTTEETNLPDPWESVLQLLFDVAAIHSQLVGLIYN